MVQQTVLALITLKMLTLNVEAVFEVRGDMPESAVKAPIAEASLVHEPFTDWSAGVMHTLIACEIRPRSLGADYRLQATNMV